MFFEKVPPGSGGLFFIATETVQKKILLKNFRGTAPNIDLKDNLYLNCNCCTDSFNPILIQRMDALLKWTTATETNNFGFDVERSKDREDWQRIGFVPGYGNSASPKDYAFADEGAASVAPLLYYRLKQIDRDGTTDYSAVAEVRAGATGFALAQNYPNPFAGATTLSYSLQQDEHVTLHLHDLLGNEVAVLAEGMQPAGSHALRLDPAALGLQPGQYLCVLRAGGRVATRKLVYMP